MRTGDRGEFPVTEVWRDVKAEVSLVLLAGTGLEIPFTHPPGCKLRQSDLPCVGIKPVPPKYLGFGFHQPAFSRTLGVEGAEPFAEDRPGRCSAPATCRTPVAGHFRNGDDFPCRCLPLCRPPIAAAPGFNCARVDIGVEDTLRDPDVTPKPLELDSALFNETTREALSSTESFRDLRNGQILFSHEGT